MLDREDIQTLGKLELALQDLMDALDRKDSGKLKVSGVEIREIVLEIENLATRFEFENFDQKMVLKLAALLKMIAATQLRFAVEAAKQDIS